MIEKKKQAPLLPDKLVNLQDKDMHGKRHFVFFCMDINGLEGQSLFSFVASDQKIYDACDCIVICISPTEASKETRSLCVYENIFIVQDQDHVIAKAYECYQKKMVFGELHWIIKQSGFLIDPEGNIEYMVRRLNQQGVTRMVQYLQRQKQKEHWRTLSRRQKEKIRHAQKQSM